ncbi:MAG: GNAT family N-acetyltransferase [Anaerolineales bacterium]
MLKIEKINTEKRREVERFVQFPYQHYRGCPQWVPPLLLDARLFLDRKKHPFYEHSDADFFLATRDGLPVGRIAALENKPFNRYHAASDAEFYFFESVDDLEVSQALFETVFDWARQRGLKRLVGPKGMGPLDGYGVLIEGFEQRQMMTMMNYNYAYYPRLLETAGFEKEVDFVSCYLPASSFQIPERVARIARRVAERGNLTVKKFQNKRELVAWAGRIGEAYNQAFVNNWEYYPLTPAEIKFVVDNIITVADQRLIKIITHGEQVVGFLFGFPDVSAALQRARGKLLPFSLPDLLLEMKRTDTVSANGMGILPAFHGHGGNALLYDELGKTLLDFKQFSHVEMTQVAESAEQMRADLKNLNGVEYKNHRVYRRNL